MCITREDLEHSLDYQRGVQEACRCLEEPQDQAHPKSGWRRIDTELRSTLTHVRLKTRTSHKGKTNGERAPKHSSSSSGSAGAGVGDRKRQAEAEHAEDIETKRGKPSVADGMKGKAENHEEVRRRETVRFYKKLEPEETETRCRRSWKLS